jgi:hypothetical protein
MVGRISVPGEGPDVFLPRKGIVVDAYRSFITQSVLYPNPDKPELKIDD